MRDVLRRILVAASVGFLSSSAVGGSADDPAPAKEAARPRTRDEQLLDDLVNAHNEIRTEAKRPPLRVNSDLSAAARVHALDMAKRGAMSHDGSDGSTAALRVKRAGYKTRTLAENVAYGQGTVSQAMRAWMDSEHHKANILGEYSEIGVARALSDDGTNYWCVEFATAWPRLAPDEARAEFLSAMNELRKGSKKPALKIQPKLQAAAQAHAEDMAKAGKLREENDDGKTPDDAIKASRYRFAAMVHSDSTGFPLPNDLIQEWLKKDGTRESLFGDFSDIGIGYALDRGDVPYWSILLAKPQRRR